MKVDLLSFYGNKEEKKAVFERPTRGGNRTAVDCRHSIILGGFRNQEFGIFQLVATAIGHRLGLMSHLRDS